MLYQRLRLAMRKRSLPESSAVRTGTGRHHSIFDSVQVLSDAELAEIEEEERRFRESLTGLPPRKRKPDIETLTEPTEAAAETAEAEESDPAEAESRESKNTEAAAPENTESENTEAANAGGPES